MGNLNKPQNISYNQSNKTLPSSEKLLISHGNDTTIESQEAVKRNNQQVIEAINLDWVKEIVQGGFKIMT